VEKRRKRTDESRRSIKAQVASIATCLNKIYEDEKLSDSSHKTS
jgi:hypothetical protein